MGKPALEERPEVAGVAEVPGGSRRVRSGVRNEAGVGGGALSFSSSGNTHCSAASKVDEKTLGVRWCFGFPDTRWVSSRSTALQLTPACLWGTGSGIKTGGISSSESEPFAICFALHSIMAILRALLNCSIACSLSSSGSSIF